VTKRKSKKKKKERRKGDGDMQRRFLLTYLHIPIKNKA
jgi:hypothetical protein